MSDIGKIEQLTTHPVPFKTPWMASPLTISLAEHDRTLGIVLSENARLRVERAHSVDVLTTFRDAPPSIASISKVLDLLDELLNGPKQQPAQCLVSAADYATHFAEPTVLAFPQEAARLCTYCATRPAEDQSDFCGAICRLDAEQE